MTKILNFVFLTLLILFTTDLCIAKNKKLRVVIDPGHGGLDSGTTFHNHRESKLSLIISKTILQKINEEKKIKASLTRTKDHELSLADRALASISRRADVLISIHVNSNPNPKIKGAEFYIQNHLPPDEESLLLAKRENLKEQSLSQKQVNSKLKLPKNIDTPTKNILRDLHHQQRTNKSARLAELLAKNWQGPKRVKKHQIKQAPFYLVSRIGIPSILIELGYLTNSRDRKLLNSTKHQKLIANSIVKALKQYKVIIDKDPSSILH